MEDKVALNIKNVEVERLAAEVAELCGETKTEAIRKALEERKARLKSRIALSQVDQAWRFLELEVWPRLEGQRAPAKTEVEDILGYSEGGV